MNGILARNLTVMQTRARLRRALHLLTLGLLVASFETAAQERTTAVWKERDVNFFYHSSTTIYTCDAIQDRVASIVRALGARDDVRVKVDNCKHFIAPDDTMNPWQPPTDRFHSSRFGSDSMSREQSVNVRIHLVSPIEATPKVLEEWKKEQSRRKLVARVTGNPAAVIESTGQFPAEWRTVTLSRSSVGLEPEECELLDQMSTSVFREMGVRNVQRGYVCNPHETSHIAPKVTAEVLMSSPFAASPAPEAPAAGESEAHPSAPASSDAAPSSPPPPVEPRSN